jgi:hypothetical protein
MMISQIILAINYFGFVGVHQVLKQIGNQWRGLFSGAETTTPVSSKFI